MNAPIPSRYAVSQAFRTIYASAALNGTDVHWLQWARKGVASRRLDIEALARDIQHGPTSSSLTCMVRTDGRRLGRRATTFNVGRLVADRFVSYEEGRGWGADQQVLVLRRETIEARADHLEERSSPSGIAVTRHALERLYEREGCDQCVIHKRMLCDLAEADHTLAFAVAAGLFVKGDPLDVDACTVLPVGQGLLYVRNAGIAMRAGTNPASRYVVVSRGVHSKPVISDPDRHIPVSRLGHMEVDGHLLAMGMTYLSSDLLYLEQHAYAALFKAEAAKHDLATLAAEAGRTWLPHEKRPVSMHIEVDPRLRYLLSQIVQPKPPGHMCLSIGWSGSDDPRPVREKKIIQEN